MPVDAGLADLSNSLLVAAILAYTVAMFGYTVEYAFGRRGRIAVSAHGPGRSKAKTSVLVGAGGPPADAPVSPADAPVPAVDDRVGSVAPVSPAVGGAALESRTGTPGAGADRPADDPAAASDGSRPSSGRAALFGKFAVVAAVFGALCQAGCLLARGLSAHRVPWGNMYEFVSVVCLVSVVAWLVVSARRPVRHLGTFVMLPVVLLLGLAGTVLYTRSAPLMPALNSYWLAIHVSAAATAAGVFMFGFVSAVLYLIRRSYEVRSEAGKPLRFPATIGPRLPASAVLERMTFRIHAFAFPIWTFAVIAGAIWAEAAWSRYWGWDPKETWAFISWVVYAAYLHARATAGWRGTRATAIAVLGWATMMVNLFVINFVVSGLHSYAGVGS